MTPFTLDGELYVVAGYPGSAWAANARAAGTGTLSRGRKHRTVHIVELDVEQSRPALRSFAKRAGLVVDGTPDEFERLAGRLAVFRFDEA